MQPNNAYAASVIGAFVSTSVYLSLSTIFAIKRHNKNIKTMQEWVKERGNEGTKGELFVGDRKSGPRYIVTTYDNSSFVPSGSEVYRVNKKGEVYLDQKS